jgi:5-methylcytosine-specific restriction endonuclease McrA
VTDDRPDYATYIQSDAWKAQRQRALQRTAQRDRLRWPHCEGCLRRGSGFKNPAEDRFRVEGSNGLHIHHLHYRNLGNEQPEDLVVLCTKCHNLVHENQAVRAELERRAALR